MCGVDYEVTPQPEGDEREALERALAELLADELHPAYRSAWRHAALVESTGVYRLGDSALAE